MLDLGQIRNEIDGIDKQLVELFEQRMKLTKEVAEYKIQTGKKVLDREREKAKIESVTKLPATFLEKTVIIMMCLHGVMLWRQLRIKKQIMVCFQ